MGHFFIDLYSGALGALQPRLVEQMGLSLTQAGILGGLLVFSASLCQPLYGTLSDRYGSRLFTVLAPAVAGLFISCVGVAPNYAVLVLFVLLGGAGIASFHPQASAWVTQGVSTSRGTMMAVFISAGTLGMAFGPTYFSFMLQWLGLDRLWWASVPGLLCSAMLWQALGPPPRPASKGRLMDLGSLRVVWKPLSLLFWCVFIRSIVQVTFAQLLPLYLHRERGFSIPLSNYTLSAYLAFGALGGFLGGRLTDRIGGRKVIMISMLGTVPLLLLFFLTTGWLSILGLLAGGLMLLFTIPVNVVMAQELAPGRTGVVSALMMGFAWGTAGLLFVPLTGRLSETWGMHPVMASLSLFPLIGFALARALPEPGRG